MSLFDPCYGNETVESMVGAGDSEKDDVLSKRGSKPNAERKHERQNKQKILAFQVSHILISVLFLWFLYVLCSPFHQP